MNCAFIFLRYVDVNPCIGDVFNISDCCVISDNFWEKSSTKLGVFDVFINSYNFYCLKKRFRKTQQLFTHFCWGIKVGNQIDCHRCSFVVKQGDER